MCLRPREAAKNAQPARRSAPNGRINYREADFVAVVKEATGGRGVDVILDMVGGDYLQRNLDALAMEGRLVQVSTLGGAKAEINLVDRDAASG